MSVLALYSGGMGAPGKNFYYDLAVRYGYADAAAAIQAAYLSGERDAAAHAVPDDLVDDVVLCGPPARIAERIDLWRNVSITTLNAILLDDAGLRVMADLLL